MSASGVKNIGVYDASAVDLDRAKIKHRIAYEWTEPKDDLAAILFPSEETWHPLYDHNIVEYANVLYSIDGDIDNQIADNPKDSTNLEALREKRKNKVKSLIKQSFLVKAKSRFIISCIVFVIIFLIITFFYYKNRHMMSGMFYAGAVAVCAILPMKYAYNLFISAPGEGTNAIHNYNSKISAFTSSGVLNNQVLDKINEQYNKDADRATLVASRPSVAASNIGLLGLMGLMNR